MKEKRINIEDKIGTKGLFEDVIKYSPSMMIPAMVGIIFLPIVTRLFPPVDYGNYVLVMVTISILSMFAGWVGMSVIRFYPVYEKKGESTKFTGMNIKLSFLTIFILSTFFLIIVLFMKNRIHGEFYYLLIIGIFVFILISFSEVLLSFIRIKRLVNYYSGFFVWKSITALLFGVLLVIFFRLGVEGLLFGTILSIGLALPFIWHRAIGKLQIKNKNISFQSTLEMAKYSFPLAVGNLAAWILSLSDRYMLQFFRGASEVGIYSISYQISDRSIMLFTSLFAFAFNPLSIIVWEKEGYKQGQEFLTKGTRYFLLLCIPAIVGISVLRKPILRILTTPSYYEGAKIIPFVVLGVFFLGLNQRFGAGLSFYKKTHLFMSSLIIAGCINLGLNFLFIPKYGYIAAAVTTLVSYGVLLLLTIIFSRRFFSWQFPFSSLINAIWASAIMGMVVYFIGDRLTSSTLINLILSICLAGLIYFALLFLLQEIRPKEKEVTKQIFKKLIYLGSYKYRNRN